MIVVANSGSLPSAAANSFSVSRASGDESTSAASSLRTNAAFAVSRPAASSGGVGVVGVPVNAGLSSGAFVFVSSMTVLTAFGVAASSSLSLSVSLQSCTRPFSVVEALLPFRSSTIRCASSLCCFAPCSLFAAASALAFASPLSVATSPSLSTALSTILSASLTACSARAASCVADDASCATCFLSSTTASAFCCTLSASVWQSLLICCASATCCPACRSLSAAASAFCCA
ncbi:hypothetical protein BvCmsJ77A_03432 [Escherichia coli]|nr:hypothetical protein BvCmsJ77A_03432 [Escherichia coli]